MKGYNNRARVAGHVQERSAEEGGAMQSDISIPTTTREDPLLDLAHTRLHACPAAVRDDLLACLTYLRSARGTTDEKQAGIAAVDRHHARAITLASKGLDAREDRALSLMIMAITAMRDNTEWSNAQAERTLRQIRVPAKAR
jgi:hypothetical protein